MPSRIVKGHSRIVKTRSGSICLFPTKDGKIHVTRKSDGFSKIFYLALLTPQEALTLEAALNDMIIELEDIKDGKGLEPFRVHRSDDVAGA